MAQVKITFLNDSALKVQAQIFADFTLISSCVVNPGESQSLTAMALPYDIYCKNGATGWELARRLVTQAIKIKLCIQKGRYQITDE